MFQAKQFLLALTFLALTAPSPAADAGFRCRITNGERSSRSKLYGFIETTGRATIPTTLKMAGNFHDGLSFARPVGSDLYGYIDAAGTFVTPPKYAKASNFEGGYAVVSALVNGKRRASIRDKAGTLLFPFDKYNFTSITSPAFVEKIAHAMTADTEYWLDERGEVLFTKKRIKGHSNSQHFTEGLLRFQIPNPAFETDRNAERSLFGWYDTTGEVAIPPVYGQPQHFQEGLVRIRKRAGGNTLYGFINSKGEAVLPPGSVGYGGSFRNGLAASLPVGGGKYGFIDRAGKMVVANKYDSILGFRDGICPVKTGKLWGLIDSSGATIVPPRYDKIGKIYPDVGFDSELISVVVGKKTGFINRKGDLVIPPRYHQVDRFAGGLCKVLVKPDDKEACFIDRTGKIAIPPKPGLGFRSYGRFSR